MTGPAHTDRVGTAVEEVIGIAGISNVAGAGGGHAQSVVVGGAVMNTSHAFVAAYIVDRAVRHARAVGLTGVLIETNRIRVGTCGVGISGRRIA